MDAGRYLEEVRDTLADVAAQRVRALLTLLGVIIGVGTLVFLSSLVAGAGQFLQQQAKTASGADLISVTGHWDQARQEWNKVDRRDARALARGTRADGTLVLGHYVSRVQLGRRWGERVYAIGARPESQAMYTLAVARGRFVTQADLWAQTRVAVLGAEAATSLLPGVADPLGQEVQLRGHRFRVVGVLAAKPAMAEGRRWTWDASVVVPEPAYLADLATSQEVEEIVVKVPAARLAAEGTAALVRKLEALATLQRSVRQACDATFLYWHRNLLGDRHDPLHSRPLRHRHRGL
jgi:putative ABC transport system permease protein